MLSIQREGILLLTTHLFQLSLQKIAVTVQKRECYCIIHLSIIVLSMIHSQD